MRTLTIFCSGKIGIKQDYIDSIKDLIYKIDENRIRIAYGGGDVGLMGVVRNSFLEKNGKLITSNINRFVIEGMDDDYLYDNITERQAKLIEFGDLFLVLPGGFGTLYELLEVITKNQIGEMSKTIIIYNYKGIYTNILKQIEVLQQEGFIKHELEWYKIKIFENADEISNFVNNF